MTNPKMPEILYAVFACIMLAGACTYITDWKASAYIYIIGAVGVAAMKMRNFNPKEKDKTLKRLCIQQIFAGIVFIIAGGLMIPGRPGNGWIGCFAIATLIELYTTFRISAVIGKRNRP